jgi:[FeFe] hydrogenase H-cluster maturation GTPase HydF
MAKENKPHIGIFGRMNCGKSSIINRLVGQDVAIVADKPGTTTDPVKKSVEIFGVGPAIFIDTAGIDDQSDLGGLRVKKSLQVIKTIDLAILVIAQNQYGEPEEKLVKHFISHEIPWFVIHNKSDIEPLSEGVRKTIGKKTEIVDFSARLVADTDIVTELIARLLPETAYTRPALLGDLIKRGDIVLLITPIDSEAPEGRMILPQVMAIRDILDHHCVAIVLKESEVDEFLARTQIKPALAITDSQVFKKANASIPEDVPLTSFSIMLARFKGDFESYLMGTAKISQLKDGDRILMLESCSHQVTCDDIGRMKIPRWLSEFTGKQLEYEVVAGLDALPRAVTDYALVIQCGGCVITRKQLRNRLKPAIDAGIPVTNYGMAISWVKGIFPRAIAPFMKKHAILESETVKN